MIRVTLIALILATGTAKGQGFNGSYPPPLPPPAGDQPLDPITGLPKHSADARKAARDQVLRSVGPEALAFTKRYGDLGITVLQQCSPETGKRLVALFQSGELGRLKNPQSALEAIRQHGDPAGAWLGKNHGKLVDPEALECWCKNTMDYVYDLKDIDRDAEELRASRKLVPSWLASGNGEWNWSIVVIVVLAVLLVGTLFLKRRHPAPALP